MSLGRPDRCVPFSGESIPASLDQTYCRRWPDLQEGSAIDGNTFGEVAAERVRCIAELLQCRDLYDLHELLDGGQVDPLEGWHLYLRKAVQAARRVAVGAGAAGGSGLRGQAGSFRSRSSRLPRIPSLA
jgi:hypothetical protein